MPWIIVAANDGYPPSLWWGFQKDGRAYELANAYSIVVSWEFGADLNDDGAYDHFVSKILEDDGDQAAIFEVFDLDRDKRFDVEWITLGTAKLPDELDGSTRFASRRGFREGSVAGKWSLLMHLGGHEEQAIWTWYLDLDLDGIFDVYTEIGNSNRWTERLLIDGKWITSARGEGLSDQFVPMPGADIRKYEFVDGKWLPK